MAASENEGENINKPLYENHWELLGIFIYLPPVCVCWGGGGG